MSAKSKAQGRSAPRACLMLRCDGCGELCQDTDAFQLHCMAVQHDDDFDYTCAQVEIDMVMQDLVRIASDRSVDREVQMVHRSDSAQQQWNEEHAEHAWFVLVGGEAKEYKGNLQHTSVTFVGSAYEQLRAAGIPRERIVVIASLAEYRDFVGAVPGVGAYQLAATDQVCERLLTEGGADHDYTAVNPNTVRRVLLGIGPGKVVPVSASAIFFGIYTHGDNHATVPGVQSADPLQNEWFCHLPHPADEMEMYDYVATNGAKGYGKDHPDHYLYASQIRATLAQLFAAKPHRPVIGLLNYCTSGGNLHFMRNQSARAMYGADEWPLLLMSSAKARQDALIAGMWETWWEHVALAIAGEGSPTFEQLYAQAEEEYYRRNLYELKDYITQKRTICEPYKDTYLVDLNRVLTAGAGGRPDIAMVKVMQNNYERGCNLEGKRITRGGKAIPVDCYRGWEDLVLVVQWALGQIAAPAEVHGAFPGNSPLMAAEIAQFL